MDDYRVTVITAYHDECEYVFELPRCYTCTRGLSPATWISLNSLFSTGLVLSLENFPASVARRWNSTICFALHKTVLS
jgi:hypothetical protein